MIETKNLTHIYNEGLAYETTAIDDISFEIADGELICLIGHTGSGKSTLIQHLNALLKPTSGSIYLDDVCITEKGTNLIDVRKKVGLVFQYPEYQLFEETVYKDVSFGPKNLGLTEEEIDVRVRESLDLVGLEFNEFSERAPFDLSGGQKRRVAIAGVIAMRPSVLIFDEPTAGLDPKAHADVLDMIRRIRENTGSTVIIASHNMGDVAEMADRVFVMDSGKLIKQGTPQEVFSDFDTLFDIGLSVPPATEISLMLRGERADAPDRDPERIILTETELVECLKSI
jgi:energy-coupling factor transport system ATP-binding protein